MDNFSIVEVVSPPKPRQCCPLKVTPTTDSPGIIENSEKRKTNGDQPSIIVDYQLDVESVQRACDAVGIDALISRP